MVERFHARLQQLEDLRDPGGLAADECIAPQARLPQARLYARQELRGRQACDVLLIEPVQLLGIEDGVSAADALEGEELRELVAREHFAVAAC
jgi:hypothetical protein